MEAQVLREELLGNTSRGEQLLLLGRSIRLQDEVTKLSKQVERLTGDVRVLQGTLSQFQAATQSALSAMQPVLERIGEQTRPQNVEKNFEKGFLDILHNMTKRQRSRSRVCVWLTPT